MKKNTNSIKELNIKIIMYSFIILIIVLNICVYLHTKGVLKNAIDKNYFNIKDQSVETYDGELEVKDYIFIIRTPNVWEDQYGIKHIFLSKEDVIKIIVPIIFIFILTSLGIYLCIKKIYIFNNQKLKSAMSKDRLTELINYDEFVVEAQAYLDMHKKNNCIMACFDIDKFKLVNDLYGYKTGDEILKCISRNMKNYFGESVVYGRIMGDVFGFIMQLHDKQEGIPYIVDIIRQEIGNIDSINLDINLDLSIGIYDINEEELNIKKIIDSADMARIKSKESKYESYIMFDEKLSEEKKMLIQMEHDLFSAIKNEQLILYYQPKFNINTNQIVGAEALVRWMHPTMGIVSPMVFIPMAEKSRFINYIGQWVFEEVCLRLSRWIKEGIDVVPISINLSRVELYQQDLVKNLKLGIKRYNIDPKLIEIEITETTALNDIEFMNNKLKDIKSLGIKVAMDDFGTGNSNFSNLKDISIDEVKLDRSLLLDIEKNIKTEVMVKSILNLSKNLSLSTVCEGVENMHQIEVLKTTGCEVVQGYVFSKPIDVESYKNLLIENKYIYA